MLSCWIKKYPITFCLCESIVIVRLVSFNFVRTLLYYGITTISYKLDLYQWVHALRYYWVHALRLQKLEFNKLIFSCMSLCSGGQITQHKWAYPFMQPVDVEGLGLHDYYEVKCNGYLQVPNLNWCNHLLMCLCMS